MSTKHRVVFLSLLLLVAVVQLVVARQISQNRWKEIERTQLLAVRPLTEKETLQLFLYEQVGYDYKEYSIIKKVINCESEWKISAVGDSGLATGLCQYHTPTFNQFSKEYFQETGHELVIENPRHQIILTVWAFDKGYHNHWTCYKKIA
jgi:hypothetical protein